MNEHTYAEQVHQIAETVREGRYNITIMTIAGPEELHVNMKKTNAMAGKESYQLIIQNDSNQEVGTLDYSIDSSVRPAVAKVDNKFVLPPYRGKDLAQKLFELMAKDLEDKGVLRVESRIRKENTAALVSRQHVREMLTGRRYVTQHTQSKEQKQFYDVVTFLDQFEEQGEA